MKIQEVTAKDPLLVQADQLHKREQQMRLTVKKQKAAKRVSNAQQQIADANKKQAALSQTTNN
jgi:hypothetical protein